MDYRSSYTVEIADAKEAWETELSRLHNIRFTGQDFTPEVEGHFDGNLNEYVDALGSQLTQTAVIGQINTLLDEDAIIVGAAGSLPVIYKECGHQENQIHITWSMDTLAWAMRLRAH